MNFGKIKISIPLTENIEQDKGKTFTAYAIRLELNGKTWMVRHRYNDFVDLDKKLKSLAPQVMDKIKLPGKKAVGNQDPDFIETRRKKLVEYLTLIAHHDALVNCPSFKTFVSDAKYVIENSFVDAEEFKRKQQEKYLSQIVTEDDPMLPSQPQPHLTDYSNFDFSQLHERFSYVSNQSSNTQRSSSEEEDGTNNNNSRNMYDDDLEELASSLASLPRKNVQESPRAST